MVGKFQDEVDERLTANERSVAAISKAATGFDGGYPGARAGA